MALYKGNIQISGGGSGNVREFTPENQGSTGQILTKTATGYDWETNSGGQTYTAGANITIDSNNEISAIDTTYSAGANVTIDANNEISATDTTYVAGDFDIKDLADSTGLRTSWSGKADASDVNTKTFYPINDTTDTATVQAIIEWIESGKNAIVRWSGKSYSFSHTESSSGGLTTLYYFNHTYVKQDNATIGDLTNDTLWMWYDSRYGYSTLSTYTYNSTYIPRDNTIQYTPTGDYNPATKKYVDDSLSAKISAGTTAPSNPTEGQLWYDSTNDVLKVYDGTQWNSVGGGGGGSYTAGANIDITNDVISAENVIVTDAINNTGFKVEDANDNFADVGLSNTYEIKIGNEQDDQQGNYDYTDVDLIGNTGTIGGHNYHETPSIEDHREYFITPEGIEATREITSGGETTTTTENYYWIDDGLGNTDEKIAKLGDIVTYSAGTNISIDANNEISATDTTYSAGTGLTLNGTTFNVDTTTIATKADIANLSSFEVVATLPSASSASTKTIYLLGPIGTGADKYEEWIVTDATSTQSFTSVYDSGTTTTTRTPDSVTFSTNTTLTYSTSTEAADMHDKGIRFHGTNDDYFYWHNPSTDVSGWYTAPGGTLIDATTITIPAGTYSIDEDGADRGFDSIEFSASGGKQWTKIGETSIDLSGYATTSALTSGLATKQDILTAGDGIDIDANDEISVDVTDIIGTGLSEDANNNIIIDTTVVATQTDLSNYVELGNNTLSGPSFISGSYSSGAGDYTSTLDADKLNLEASIGNVEVDLALNGNAITRTTDNSGTVTTETFGFTDGAGTNKIARLSDLSGKQDTLTASTGISIDANNQISNTLPGPVVSATAPSNPSEGDTWYDTTNDIFKTYDGTNWNVTSNFPGMTILSYGHSTWQDFINAYNENAIVYCRASSNSNPATGNQTRMAFMAYVNSATPTEVEFQYYRSRSDHNTAANQLDQVFVYKLTSASGGTWTVTERNTAAKAVAGTGISLAFGSGNMTISANAQYDDTTYASSWDGVTDKAPTKNAVYDKISAMDTTISGKQNALTAGTNIQIDSNTNTISATDTTYSAGDGIGISANNEISADISPSTQTGAASTIKIWLGSQSDYNSLASYDSGTLYFTTSS